MTNQSLPQNSPLLYLEEVFLLYLRIVADLTHLSESEGENFVQHMRQGTYWKILKAVSDQIPEKKAQLSEQKEAGLEQAKYILQLISEFDEQQHAALEAAIRQIFSAAIEEIASDSSSEIKEVSKRFIETFQKKL